MLDRLISGAGALADRADRLVRALTRGGGSDLMNHRPGSAVVVAALVVAALAFGFVAVEANDNPTPRAIAPAEVAGTGDFGRRVYSTVEGFLSDAYVETYEDENANGAQDEGEDGRAWYYFLLEPDGSTGVTVRSTRPPTEMMRQDATGVLVRDPEYLSMDVAAFPEIADGFGVSVALEPNMLVDTTITGTGEPVVLDLAEPLPTEGTYVSVSGESMGYVDVCEADTDGDGTCAGEFITAYDVYLGDRAARRAITIYRTELPKIGPIQFTGMLRREPGSIRDAKTADGLDFSTLGITVSDTYLLDDQATPGSAVLSAAIATVAGLLATVILVGLVGGYLVFRQATRLSPAGARLEPGAAIPVRVTGNLRRPDGLVHVREVAAQLVRFTLEPETQPGDPAGSPPQLDGVEAVDAAPVATADAAVDAAPAADPTPAVDAAVIDAPVPVDVPGETTLIVERLGHPEGVALGRGELREVRSGRVMPLRGPRPALRVVAGTGPLLLSFDTREDRDRAAAELIAESGLLVRDTGIAGR